MRERRRGGAGAWLVVMAMLLLAPGCSGTESGEGAASGSSDCGAGDSGVSPSTLVAIDRVTETELWTVDLDYHAEAMASGPDGVTVGAHFDLRGERVESFAAATGAPIPALTALRPPREPAVPNGIELPLDGKFYVVKKVVQGDQETFVLLAADYTVDRRLVVIDDASSQIRWTLDGVRHVASTPRGILYDRSNPTRVLNAPLETLMVDRQDPSTVLWSRSSGGKLGGFVGAVGGEEVFVVLHDTPTGYPQTAPFTRLVTATEGGPADEVLYGVESTAALSGNQIAVALDQLSLYEPGGTVRTLDAAAVHAISYSESVLYVAEYRISDPC